MSTTPASINAPASNSRTCNVMKSPVTIDSTDPHEALSLDNIRSALIRLEETVIFSLIERAQYRVNSDVYTAGKIPLPGHASESSFLTFFFKETERVHALVRRYCSPYEHPFFGKDLPSPILGILNFPRILHDCAGSINLNNQLMDMYINVLIPMVCSSGVDEHYGSTATADIACLQAISKRIHYGKFVAESKFLSDPDGYSKLVSEGNADGIWEKLTDAAVEGRLLERVLKKAETYGEEIGSKENQSFSLEQNTRFYKLLPEDVVAVYREHIIPLTKKVQVEYLLQRLGNFKYAFLGPKYSYSYKATTEYINNLSYPTGSIDDRLLPCDSFEQVLIAVASNRASCALLPFSNSQTGFVPQTYNLLLTNNGGLKIVSELYLSIKHAVILHSTDMGSITHIYSHPQGFLQCDRWLKQHLPRCVQVPVSSTSEAVRLIAEDKTGTMAAIANIDAASYYGVPILHDNICDSVKNITRFFVLSKVAHLATQSSKTLISFSPKNGLFSQCLTLFANFKISVISLNSIPSKNEAFKLNYCVEVAGEIVKEFLDGLNEHCDSVTVLGSFAANDYVY